MGGQVKNRYHRAIVLTVLTLLSFPGQCLSGDTKKYLTYDMFKSLTALCPQVHSPRLAGLEPAGQELWSKGQMRIPAETHLFEGDFNHDGKGEVAIVITGGGKNFALIAEPSGQSWRRTGLVPISNQSIIGWNQRALTVGAGNFIAWDGKRYKFEHGPLALYCYGYEQSDFGGVSLKLTYLGPQDEPYPGLLISSYYRLPALSEFKSHRKAGVSYSNDDLPAMWHVTVSPVELRQFVLALKRSAFLASAEDRTGKEGEIRHSLSMIDVSSGNRPNYFEVFLQGKESLELLDAFARQIAGKNADGVALLKEYAKMFGG